MEHPIFYFVGTHDPTFVRTAIVAEGLRRRGCEVSSCVEPVWGTTAERVAAARRGPANPRLAWRLLRAYLRLARRLNAPQSTIRSPQSAILVPYPGQLDTLVLRALFPRGRIILDAFVSLDETLADRAIGSPKGATRRLARALDRLAFRLADRVLVDTAAHARRFAADYGLDPAKAIVVPVGAFDPIAEFGLRNAQSAAPGEVIPNSALRTPRSPLRVLYFGGFIPLHGVSVILEAARILGPDADITFELVGEGQEASAAERFVAAHQLPHVRLVQRWMPEPDLVAQHITSADVCLGIFADSPKAMDVVPAKIYLALACGKAVVTADTPAVREELLDGGQGGGGAENVTPPVVVVAPADPRALADALVRLRDHPRLRGELGAAGRRLYEASFCPERVVAPLIAAIEGL